MILIKERGLGPQGMINCDECLRNMWVNLMKYKGYFSKVCLCRLNLVLTLSLVISHSLGVGEKDIFTRENCVAFTKENLCSTFRRKGEGRELVLYLLTLSCYQLKIILKPKWHTLRWRTPSILNGRLIQILWALNKITKYINIHTLATTIYKISIITH